MNKKVLVILGPTASGKSELAVRLAKKLNGEIISADSRQVYKGLDIGTGKITKKEMRGIPHHLLDVADPKKQFSVAQYKKLAEEKIKEIDFPIVVGGTGFYIDALTGRVNFPEVPPNKLLRNKLNKLSKEKLFKILKKKDPRRAKEIDPHNKVRLVRALEIIAKIGSVPPLGNLVSKWEFIYIGIKPEDLDKRIEKRVKKMFRQGLLKEIKKLKRSGISNKRLKELGFEYWNPTEENLIRNTRRYAKRQMTWFKRNPPERPSGRAGKKIRWFKPTQQKEIEKYAS
ncbi:MAG: tRNA (adenosine(37)-N6)-dimethylallyltransferase MiaA [Candidatus Zambryskibacteria bacterium RIFCSPLOWO2_12_FULL_45_14]|uniref:tRNA dimethylallyltransferase n=2 Tax=Candidatus Zambryskiibacteriota TaxID=1817925 RepID=A0A1G2ULN3_9BACT|nr:MAG: tRNA (adenosine(37)-N6)-dimethylallyltransferase MiaA [Candidatus Zambryskibacteria bacterium RIFCSPLOWO2_02_FULL_44_12b]OHB14176.1 MAG: tRNA (adenosine(37)-N6)-dimethylallyltransferase MiaA [Candidatus Zambryskibacteria bacterium RIFCSPLOWO2_12_FULL_45_14]